MRYYQIERENELRQVRKALAFYHDWADLVRSSSAEWEYLKQYYRGLLDPRKKASIEFRALFFASRIEPVLTYIENFVALHRRAPQILDLGCGFGMESLLLCATGATIHAVDVSRRKLALTPGLKKAYEDKIGGALPLTFGYGNIFELNAPGAYDAVYSSATLHHIEPALDALGRIRELIRPGGHFFLSDENGANLLQQLVVQHSLGWRTPRVAWELDPETGVNRLCGNENIRPAFRWSRLITQAALTPQTIKYCRFFPPLPIPPDRLLAWERSLRNLPLLTQFASIGFLLTATRAT